MKKSLTAILAVTMLLSTPEIGVYAQTQPAETVVMAAEQYYHGLIISGYDNSGDIIITQPEKGERITRFANISILGSCNADFPLYMNGKPVKVTTNGFFAQYVKLEEGENTFTFSNNDREATIVITRVKVDALVRDPELAIYDVPVDDSELTVYDIQVGDPELTFYDALVDDPELVIYDVPMVGTISLNYASHRTKPDESPQLLTPLAKGTVFKLIGETGEYYLIEDFTYVYKAAVEVKEGVLPEKTIESMEIVTEDEFTYLRFKINVNALYSLERVENKVKLKIFASHDLSGEPDITNSQIASFTRERYDGGFIYDLSLNGRINGHFVGFEDGLMTVGFKHAPDVIEGAKVVLDAGHGGKESGALGPPGASGPVEKDFNLYVTLAAKKYLESRGAEVRLIRSGDDYVTLAERVTEILDYKPDISVSVHSNSMPVTEDFNLFTGPLMYYTFDGGKKAAGQIHEKVVSRLGFEYKEPIRENFALTRITNCPAILFEMSFLSNPTDYERMLDISFLDSLGEALGEGIEEYLLSLTK